MYACIYLFKSNLDLKKVKHVNWYRFLCRLFTVLNDITHICATQNKVYLSSFDSYQEKMQLNVPACLLTSEG